MKSDETCRTLFEDVFYPDHEPRTESATFRASKRAMKKESGYVCAVCGDDQAVESHHRFFEWAFSNAIDWKWIRDVALRMAPAERARRMEVRPQEVTRIMSLAHATKIDTIADAPRPSASSWRFLSRGRL
ncbi:hypothetical protein [Burkholderia sp. F1]|uniref:hypothetical protein n=1 Tax=Burkholderia sp. F1 TaxID=3366817 RepID=UPI003D73566A